MATDLPCDGDGVCMVCKTAPPEGEAVTRHTCTTPWHAPCLSRPLPSLTSVIDWESPDCSPSAEPVGAAALSSAAVTAPTGGSSELVAAIRAIEADATLTEQENARRLQTLLGGGTAAAATEEEKALKGKGWEADGDDMLDLIDEKFKCAFCMQLSERPVTVMQDNQMLNARLK